MALSVQQFIKLANYYNQTTLLMSAICVQKGGIPMENYAGRMFAADVLEYIVEYAKRLMATGVPIPADVARAMKQFDVQYNRVKHLVTPTQKPIYEMSLAEFEKFMNI